ncbi:MAG: 50S ribosomal protein L30 [Deltaproteobacteria bacterium]|nr:50S ribosomal protein L30 [Deltaproteobacteria bacterium]
MGQIKITQTRSVIGQKEPHRKVLRALGLRRRHQSVTHANTPTIRGMVKKVLHMVVVEELP